MSSSSSGDLFTYSTAPSVPAFEQPARADGDNVSHKRARVMVLDDDEDDGMVSQEKPVAAARLPVSPGDDAGWLPPPPTHSRAARVLTEEEQRVLRLQQQALEELQRPAPEEVEDDEPSAPGQAAEPPASSATLVIWLQSNSGKKLEFPVTSDTRFATVFDAYCERAGVARSQVTFSFDGDPLQPDATPGDVDMMDDDVIDVKGA